MILSIITQIIFPIFAMIGVGVLLDKALTRNHLFTLDVGTLSKLNFYIFVPAIALSKLLDVDTGSSFYTTTLAFSAIHMLLLLGISWLVFSLPSFKSRRALLTQGALFNNCGNYGLPLMQLAFGDLGSAAQAIVLVFQNFTNFTLGIWLFDSHPGKWRLALANILKTPVIYIVMLAIGLQTFGLELPQPLQIPIHYLGDGLIPVSMITLGVQLSRTRIHGKILPISTSVAMRLLVSPALALGLAILWERLWPGQMGTVGPVLVVGAGLPVAINVYILAQEYAHEPETASQLVFWSTLLSAVTITGWLTRYVH